ncbi:MAG: nucleotidyltransferase domain-containing protein [Bacteroidetes bacterium]|nr:nucleotidyltransferase domain-containing protein [Bacteroidota bacterium]
MISLITNNLKDIKLLCQKHRIAKLWLFGSALDETEFGVSSDVDFLFTFDDGGSYDPEFPYVDGFLDLKTDLEKLLERNVDLVGYKKFRNPYFREAVENTKLLIYDKESSKVSV